MLRTGLFRKVDLITIIVFLFFALLFFSRIVFLSADSPFWSLNVEEKTLVYNARNKVISGDWDSGGNIFQPILISPLGNLISYLSFSIFDISLLGLRIPYIFLTFIGFIFYYFLLRKEFGRTFALFGTALLSTLYLITLVNRSALAENLFLFLMIMSLFFYQKGFKKEHYFFLAGLFAFLNLMVKLNGGLFILIPVLALTLTGKNIRKRLAFKMLFSGILAGLLVHAFLFGIFYRTGSLISVKYLVLFYLGFIDPSQSSLDVPVFLSSRIGDMMRIVLHNIVINFRHDIPRFFRLYVPFLPLLGSISIIPLALFGYRRISELDKFNLLWLAGGLLFNSLFYLYYKRLLFLLPPICYFVTRASAMFWNSCFKKESNATPWYRLLVPYLLHIIFILLIIKVIHEIAHYFPLEFKLKGLLERRILLGSLLFISLSFGITVLLDHVYHRGRYYHYLWRFLFGAYLIFLLYATSYTIVKNVDRSIKNIYLPQEGIKYLTYKNSKDLGEILEPTTIVGNEIAFRMLGFENHHKFIFNSDGGQTAYLDKDLKEIINREDIRYFCLFYDQHPSQKLACAQQDERLQTILSHYPRTKLVKVYKHVSLDRLFVAPVNLDMRLYDKYPMKSGGRQGKGV